MNSAVINKQTDLIKIINKSIYISAFMDEEIYANMWALTFSVKVIKGLKIEDLKEFLNKLIEKRSLQLSLIDAKLKATFYLWFDQQALQLRFNLICDRSDNLPFSCMINQLKDPNLILQNFIVTTKRAFFEHEVFEVIDLGSADEDDEENTYELDVYVVNLPM